MKRNIWITITYDGTAYSGFQRQLNNPSIQEIIENALHELTGEKNILYFVARTDAGVHAYGQECTFYTESSIPGDRFIFALNARLPKDIRITKSCEMPYNFSVRKQNYGKTYAYLMNESHDIPPFLEKYTWAVGYPLNIEQMKKGASLLEGTHDFTSFRGQNSVPSSPIRHIHRIDLKKSDKGIHLFVTGEGFLYHMVRNMAGALADIGRGKLSLEDIPDILQAKDRKRLGVTAPAKGLCLLKVYFQPITNKEIDNTLQGNYFPWNI